MPAAAAAVATWWGSLTTLQAVVAVVQIAAVASSVYGGLQQRRKAKRAAAEQRDAFNAQLTDRTVNLLGADNPWPVVYGEATVGASFAALLTSGARDEFKHLVAVWAAHECEGILDVQINGESIGPLDESGYVTPGSRWYREGTEARVEYVVLATGGTLTLSTDIQSLVSVAIEQGGSGGDGGVDPQPVPVPIEECTFEDNVVTVPSALASAYVGTTFIVNYLSRADSALVRVRHHLGQPGQLADPDLIATVPGDWAASDRGEGICYSWFELNLLEPEFQGGPPLVTVTLRGKKLYDPRLDSTQPGGSGPQRFEDPSTHTFSRNNALAIADFLCAEYGKLARKQHVNWPSVMAAANDCDVPATYGSTTQPLYTCNGRLDTSQDPDATLEALCQSMAGFATLNGGWYVQAGAYSAPVMALTDADNAGPIDLVPVPGIMDVANGLRGRFYDPERYNQLTDYVPYQNAGFVAVDNGVEAWDQLDMPFTDSPLRCHQLARVMLERSRGTSLAFPAKLRALRLRPGQRVTLTLAGLGIVNQVFRVTKKEHASGGPVKLTLVQDDPSFYDLVDAPAPLALPLAPRDDPFRVQPVQNLQVATGSGALEVDANGQVFARVLLTFDASTDALVLSRGALQVEYRRHSDPADEWLRFPEEAGTATSVRLNLRGNTLYVLRVRWRNAIGVPSEWRVRAVLTDGDSAPGMQRFTAYVAGPVIYSTVT